MRNNKCGIYKIENKFNGMLYIGSAINIKQRFRQHKSDLKLNKHHSIHLQRAWNKHWEHLFEFSVIEYIEDKTKLIEKEQFWINITKCYDRNFGYNMSALAYSQLGMKRSEKTKAKLSLSNKGRKTSEETKLKISLIHKGKVTSKETKVKMSMARLGITCTKETKQKMSIAAKNRIISKETREKMNLSYHRNRLISSFVIEAL